MTLKNTAGLMLGALLIVISLLLVLLGRPIALALLLVGIPLVIWGASSVAHQLRR